MHCQYNWQMHSNFFFLFWSIVFVFFCFWYQNRLFIFLSWKIFDKLQRKTYESNNNNEINIVNQSEKFIGKSKSKWFDANQQSYLALECKKWNKSSCNYRGISQWRIKVYALLLLLHVILSCSSLNSLNFVVIHKYIHNCLLQPEQQIFVKLFIEILFTLSSFSRNLAYSSGHHVLAMYSRLLSWNCSIVI